MTGQARTLLAELSHPRPHGTLFSPHSPPSDRGNSSKDLVRPLPAPLPVLETLHSSPGSNLPSPVAARRTPLQSQSCRASPPTRPPSCETVSWRCPPSSPN